jgi:hypothetical protein
MTMLNACAVVSRVLVLAVLTWLLAGLAAPTVDPFVVDSVWLTTVGVVLAVPWSRGAVLRWVTTGQIRRAD